MSLPPLSDDDLQSIVAQTGHLWEQMRNGRIFITGGTGFFGSWLLESFAAANAAFDLNAEAVVLTRNPSGFATKSPHLISNSSIQLHQGDVADFSFPSGAFTHLIHAGTTSCSQVSHSAMARTILSGTQRVLSFAASAGVKQMLFTSSGAVYGPQPPELDSLEESHPGAPPVSSAPHSVYGEGKRMAEVLCCIAHQETGLEVKIARGFTFVGPHLPIDAHFAIGNFIRDALSKRPITVQGDGTPYRSYLYMADLAIWLWTILFKGASVRPYNVGSSQAISIRNLAETVGTIFGLPAIIAKTPAPDVPPTRYIPDTRRAEAELGLRIFTPLTDAIRKTAQWHTQAC